MGKDGKNMKCSNCGNEWKEGEKFCSVCGQPLSEEVTDQNQNVTWQNGPTADLQTRKPMKLNKGIIAAIVAVAAILVAFVGVKAFQGIQKALMNPTEYYKKVETENRDAQRKSMEQYMGTVLKSMDMKDAAKKVDMEVSISDTAKSMLSLSGVDFSSLDSIGLNMTVGKDKDAMNFIMGLKTNGEDLLSMKMYSDMKQKEMYYQIPELSKSYVDISSGLSEMEDGQTALLEEYMSGNIFPLDNKELGELYARYTDILIDSAKDVKKTSGTCKAEGVSMKVDNYEMQLKSKELAKLTKELLTTLKNDKQIEKLIESLEKNAVAQYNTVTGQLGSSEDMNLSEYKEEIQEALDGLEEEDFKNVTATLTAQIADDKIVGRKISIESSEQNDKIVITYAMPRDGEKFGCSLIVNVGDKDIVKVSGKGTEKNGVTNGEFVLGLDNSFNTSGTEISMDKLLKIEMEDYDTSKIEEGEISGKCIYSTDAVAALANYAISVENEGNLEKSEGKIEVLMGKQPVVSIDVKAENCDQPDSVKPSDSDTVYDVTDAAQMAAYQSEIDVYGLLNRIQEKTGIDLSNLLSGLGSGLDDNSFVE